MIKIIMIIKENKTWHIGTTKSPHPLIQLYRGFPYKNLSCKAGVAQLGTALASRASGAHPPSGFKSYEENPGAGAQLLEEIAL